MTQDDLIKLGTALYSAKDALSSVVKLCEHEELLQKHTDKFKELRRQTALFTLEVSESIKKMIEKQKGPRDNIGDKDDEMTVEKYTPRPV